jgi:hypothetical protein
MCLAGRKLGRFEHHGDRCFYYDVLSHANGDEPLELAKALKHHGLGTTGIRIWTTLGGLHSKRQPSAELALMAADL